MMNHRFHQNQNYHRKYIRFRFEKSDYNPTVIENGGIWTKVADSSYNDWDWYCEDTNWENKFNAKNGWSFTKDNKTSIIATGDMSNVISVTNMFYDCTGLTSISENAFPNLTSGSYMFSSCTSLTRIPENLLPNLTTGYTIFTDCTNVQHGALGLYRNWQEGGKVIQHEDIFLNCGKDTETGLAELQQIPQSWGGLAEG